MYSKSRYLLLIGICCILCIKTIKKLDIYMLKCNNNFIIKNFIYKKYTR